MQNLKHKSKFYPFSLVYIIVNVYFPKKIKRVELLE